MLQRVIAQYQSTEVMVVHSWSSNTTPRFLAVSEGESSMVTSRSMKSQCISGVHPHHLYLELGEAAHLLKAATNHTPQEVFHAIPVGAVQLHHLILQLLGLAMCQLHVLGVVGHVHLGIVLAQLRLQGVGTQQCQCDEGAGQPACQDVLTELETQVVPAEGVGQSRSLTK